MCVSVSVCCVLCVVVVLVVVVVVEGGEEEGGREGGRRRETNRTIWAKVFPLDNWSSTASSGRANDWRNREHVVLDLFSN